MEAEISLHGLISIVASIIELPNQSQSFVNVPTSANRSTGVFVFVVP